jgi:glycosyltransferase involved in cell wall biosynthesis
MMNWLRRLNYKVNPIRRLRTKAVNLKSEVANLKSEVVNQVEELQRSIDLLDYCQGSLPNLTTPLRHTQSPMKIGCSYNLANNLYNLTRCLRRANVDAELVLWRTFDYSILGDPRWETESIAIDDFDQLQLDLLDTPQPDGVVEISKNTDASIKPVSTPFPKHLLLAYQAENLDEYLQKMREYDLLVVSGQAILLAPFIGKPYITFPHGGDIYETPFRGDAFGKLTRAGWSRANAHVLSGGNFFHYAQILGLHNTTYIPILIDTDSYCPADSAIRTGLLQRYECERIFIAPVRHNWKVKGNDRIIEAIARVKETCKVRFKVLFTTWGDDLEKSKALIAKKGLEETCIFIGTFSKKLLHEYMEAADAVLDQFCLGEYGTLTLETMAMAKPVILYYRWKNPLPILNAFSVEDIARQMLFVLEHPTEAAELGKVAREWVVQHHGPAAVVPKFQQVFEAVLNGEQVPQFPVLME